MPVSAQVASDSIAVVGKTASVGVAVAMSPVVSGLLISAGVSAASAPVVGWIIGGILGATAGTILLVQALHAGKIRKQEAIQQAQALGIPDADTIPSFLVQALKQGPAWRGKQAGRLNKSLVEAKRKGHLDRKSAQKNVSKLRLLLILDANERAAALGNGPKADVSALEQEHGAMPVDQAGSVASDSDPKPVDPNAPPAPSPDSGHTGLMILGAVGLVGILAWAVTRPRS